MKTTSVARRRLHFETIEDVLAEIDRIREAATAGDLQATGNWTAGQILSHVAAWIEYGYDGFPMNKAPWFVRVLLRLRFQKFLRHGLPAGKRIPRVPDGTYGMDDLPVAAAAERVRRAFLRLDSGEEPTHVHPAFGAMTHADRVRLNLRHAELHFGFLRY